MKWACQVDGKPFGGIRIQSTGSMKVEVDKPLEWRRERLEVSRYLLAGNAWSLFGVARSKLPTRSDVG